MPTVKNQLKATAKNTNASPHSRFVNDTHGLDTAKLSSIGWHQLVRPSYWRPSHPHEYLANVGVGTPTLLHLRHGESLLLCNRRGVFLREFSDGQNLISNPDDRSMAMLRLEQEAMLRLEQEAMPVRLDNPKPIKFVQMKGTWTDIDYDYWEAQEDASEGDYSDSETDEEVELSEEEKKIQYGDWYAAWQLKVDLQAGMIGKEGFEWRMTEAIQRPEVAALQFRWPSFPGPPKKCN